MFAEQSVLILGRNNGVGLDRDASLVAEILEGADLTVEAPPPRNLLRLFGSRGGAAAAIHLERVWPLWQSKAAEHFLIPNQERYPHRQLGRLRRINHVLCKSKHAQEIFSRHHSSVHYLGFTSENRWLPDVKRNFGSVLHLAGRSSLKNTALIVELWRNHPLWPTLTLVQHGDHRVSSIPDNVRLIDGYIADSQLRVLQNECGIHLCPSLAEGWGHYIAEGMSCGAVVVTTDGPPMNELVGEDRGIVVPVSHATPRHLGTMYHVDPKALEEAIEGVFSMSTEEKLALGARARGWFAQNDLRFRSRLTGIISELALRR